MRAQTCPNPEYQATPNRVPRAIAVLPRTKTSDSARVRSRWLLRANCPIVIRSVLSRPRRSHNAGDNALVTVIGIFGPTASGKSPVAEALTERIPAELVSADAMQVYRGLPILTNQSAYPARLVGIWPLDQEVSVGAYAPLAHAAIDEILAAGRTPVVVGGTGLYLRAALVELALPPPPAPGARERWAG